MALTTVNKLKTVWLNDQSTVNDTRYAVLISQAEAIINSICKQPVNGTAVAHDFMPEVKGNSVHLLHYSVPVVLNSLQYRELPTDSWTTASGATAFTTGGVTSIYFGDTFTANFYRANLTVGYDGTTHTVPRDLESVCCEMVVDLFKMTDFGGRENRFGLTQIANNEGGTTQTTVFKDMTSRFRRKLLPWVLRSWL